MEVDEQGNANNPYSKERYTYNADGYPENIYIQEEAGVEQPLNL